MTFDFEAFTKTTKLFTIVPNSINVWDIQSITGSLFSLRQRHTYSDILIEHKLKAPSLIISAYSFGKMTEIAAAFGIGITRPAPIKTGTVAFSLKRIVYSDTLNHKVMESELAGFSTVVEAIEDYIDKIVKDCELTKVDISMWENVDVNITDVPQLIERRYLTYCSWEDFADSIIDSDIEDDFKEKMIGIITACSEFEIANEHLCLPEIAIELLMLVEKAQTATPAPMEIN